MRPIAWLSMNTCNAGMSWWGKAGPNLRSPFRRAPEETSTSETLVGRPAQQWRVGLKIAQHLRSGMSWWGKAGPNLRSPFRRAPEETSTSETLVGRPAQQWRVGLKIAQHLDHVQFKAAPFGVLRCRLRRVDRGADAIRSSIQYRPEHCPAACAQILGCVRGRVHFHVQRGFVRRCYL